MARLREEHGLEINADAVLSRAYPGHWQRKEGAWTWFIMRRHPLHDIGSHYPVTELLKAKTLLISQPEGQDINVDPCR